MKKNILTFTIFMLNFFLIGCIENNYQSDNIRDQIKLEKEDRRNTRLKTLPPQYKDKHMREHPLDK